MQHRYTASLSINTRLDSMKKFLLGKTKNIIVLDAALLVLAVAFMLASPSPDQVNGLKLTASSFSSASIEWEATDNAKGYRIYRAEDNGDFEYIEMTNENKFTDENLRTGKKYRYAVVSRNGIKGSLLDKTKAVEVVPKLSKPTIALETKNGKMELNISKVEGALTYEVFRDNETIGRANGTTYVDEEAKPDEPHMYKVKAVRYVDNPVYSAFSNSVEAELHSVPNLVLAATSDSIEMVWDSSEYYDEYRVYYNGELLGETEDTHFDIDEYNIDETYDIKLVGIESESEVQSPAILKKIKVVEEPMDNEGARKAACEWGLAIAADDSFAYGTGGTAHRPGCYFCGTNRRIKGSGYEKTYCCNPFVHACYAHGAGDPQILSDCQRGRSVGMAASNYTKYGNWENMGKPSIANLEAGDVLVNSGHVMLYAGDGIIVHAKTEGWGANTIGTDDCARYYGMVDFVMRYTGTGSGTMLKVREVDENGNVIDNEENSEDDDDAEEGTEE